MKYTILTALALVSACLYTPLIEAQTTRSGAGLSRQVQALKSALDSFSTQARTEMANMGSDIADLQAKIRDCSGAVHGEIQTNVACPSGYRGNMAQQCVSGQMKQVFTDLYGCQRQYTWVNLINRTETNANACARIGMKPITDPSYATCASGENRFNDGENAASISYRYGTWGPTRPSIGPNISANRAGHYCYHNTQRRDSDGSDLAVAALCQVLDPGDPPPNPQPVAPYVPPPPPQNER